MFEKVFPKSWISPRGVMAKMLDSKFEVNEFELNANRYIYFQIHTLERVIKPLYLLYYELNKVNPVLL